MNFLEELNYLRGWLVQNARLSAYDRGVFDRLIRLERQDAKNELRAEISVLLQPDLSRKS